MEKVVKQKGILYICHNCGCFNLETADWILSEPFEAGRVGCGNIIYLTI